MIRMRRARLTAGILLGVGAVVAPLAGASGAAAASNQSPNTPTQVPAGINAAALPGATVFGSTPPGTQVTVSFVLKEQGISSLEAQVESGIPQSNYLSVSQFAARYGQPASNISALTSYLAGFGITTTVYPDDVNVVANGTAGDFNKALTITEENVNVPQQAGFGGLGPIRAQKVYSPKQAPLLPYRLASFVTAILGLSNYGPFVSDIAKPSSYSKPQQGSSNTCVAEFGLPNGCHLPSDFAKWYDLDPLYAKGASGAGQTLGIVTLASVDSGAPQYFWQNISHTNRTGTFSVDAVDGGSGAASANAGSDETDLDIEQSGALAPGANVISYQAPNTDYGFSDGFFSAASQNVASTVSTSWGESETVVEAAILSGQESSGLQAATDEAFLEMAAQGQSMFVASGDEGAYAAARDLGTTNVSIQTPSDSPYVTAAGGSTLPWTGTFTGPDGSATVNVPAQRIWAWDYLWGPIAQVNGVPLAQVAESEVEGSTGGFSSVESTPSYQRNVSGTADFHAVQYLTPTDYTQIAPGLTEPIEWNFNATPSVTFGIGSGRAVPDISADADPETGYLVYGASVGGLNEYGGTSFVAPQLNGATAVIDSSLGHRVGFWNPAVYHAAASGFNAFTQLNATGTSNDNILYTGNPGQEYNQGVGLGLPDLAKLAGLFGAQLPF
jgi:kumamolisin